MDADQEPVLEGQGRLLDHMRLVEEVLDEIEGRGRLRELVQTIGNQQAELAELTARVDALAVELSEAARRLAASNVAAARRSPRQP